MPELPEVETIIRELNKKTRGFLITGARSAAFKLNDAVGRKIADWQRIGKYLICRLSGRKSILIHLRMSGRIFVGRKGEEAGWPYLRMALNLEKNKVAALSDLRKFATVKLTDDSRLFGLKELKKLGPDPLAVRFREFRGAFQGRTGAVKTLLLNQSAVCGIGNIYADEILWEAGVHPLQRIGLIGIREWRSIFDAVRRILREAIAKKGISIQTYRLPSGAAGEYQDVRKVYHRTGEPCFRCGAKIQKIKVNQRSTHFCPRCQENKGIPSTSSGNIL